MHTETNKQEKMYDLPIQNIHVDYKWKLFCIYCILNELWFYIIVYEMSTCIGNGIKGDSGQLYNISWTSFIKV